MVSISKSTYISNIWRNFYDTISHTTTGVKTVTLADESTQTIQTYTSAYPDIDLNEKSDFPLIVIESPKVSEEDFTLGKSRVSGTIRIEVYSTKSEASELFLDAIRDKVETNKDDYAALGLKPVRLEDTDQDSFMRGEIKVHMRAVVYNFEYKYSKTRAF